MIHTDDEIQPPARPRRGRLARGASWIARALALGLVAAGAVSISGESGRSQVLETLYPLDPGTTWIYDTKTNGGPTGRRVVQVSESALVVSSQFSDEIDRPVLPASVLSVRWDSFLGGGPRDEVEYVGHLGRSAVYLGKRRAGGDLEASDPPSAFLREPLGRGRSWRYKGTLGESKREYTRKVAAIGSTSVAGRRYRDCLHIRHTEKGGSEEQAYEAVADEWFCPGVGLVRSLEKNLTAGLTLELELAAYVSPSRSFGATAASEPAEPASFTDPGHTNQLAQGGLDPARTRWIESRTADTRTAPGGSQGRIVFGEEDGTIAAMDAASGDIVWRAGVRAPALSRPLLGEGVVIVADGNRSLHALDADDGAPRWIARFSDNVAAQPVVQDSTVVVGTEDASVHGISLRDGDRRWSRQLQDALSAPPAAGETAVLLADRASGLTAVDAKDGSILWRKSLDDPIVSGPSVREDTVVVADGGGVVYGFDVRNGRERWNHSAGGSTVISRAFAVDDERVVFRAETATGAERVVALGLGDGAPRWTTEVRADMVHSPVIVGTTVAAVTWDGELVQLDAGSGRILRRGRLPGASGRVPVPMSIVDGALVVTMRVSAPSLQTRYYALETDPRRESKGVVLRAGIRRITSIPRAAATMDGGDVIFPGFDASVWRVPPGGSPRRVYRGEGFVPYAIRAGSLIITHAGTDVVGVGPDGRTAWSYTAGEATATVRPDVSGSILFVPVADGLAAIELRTGRELWKRNIEGAGLTSPLALPGGDVVYGRTDVARFSAAGDLVWRTPGLLTLFPMAFADGTVFVIGLDAATNAIDLVALDAATGAERWRTPVQPQLLLGPASDEGVVVVGEDSGLRAFDAEDGRELWSVRLRSSLGGQPAIDNGRVVIVEGGRLEDLNSREYRVRVLDARTGAYLSAVELGGALTVPLTAGYGEGNVIAPTSQALTLFEIR